MMQQKTPVTVAQQLTPHEYKRLLNILGAAVEVIEPLGKSTSLMYHSVQVGGMVYFAFY
jgi:hypothetical protein